jgi:hypothetical protein
MDKSGSSKILRSMAAEENTKRSETLGKGKDGGLICQSNGGSHFSPQHGGNVVREKDGMLMRNILNKPRDLEFKLERSKEEHIKYFRNLVVEESFYENTLADHWEHKLKTAGPESLNSEITEEGADQIRLAIGQSRLFLKQKMQQFVGLIDECEHGVSENPPSPTDLAGFWEMIYMQVKNIHAKFDKLDDLSANNWKTPQKSVVDGTKGNGTKKVANPSGKPKNQVAVAPAQASSKIREAIEKARAAKAARSANSSSLPGPSDV